MKNKYKPKISKDSARKMIDVINNEIELLKYKLARMRLNKKHYQNIIDGKEGD